MHLVLQTIQLQALLEVVDARLLEAGGFAFPAAGARDFGLVDVPLLCAQEMNVDGALERVVRILVHADITGPRSQIQHVYLRGAEVLRQDLVQ